MKIIIEVPDGTLALVATFVYNGDVYPCINIGTKVLTSEDIEKQKADDEIKVGDEVEVLKTGTKYLIAWTSGTNICGFSYAGITCRFQPSDVRKTGRHFDIDKILEAMKK